jgi:hypothetical protein
MSRINVHDHQTNHRDGWRIVAVWGLVAINAAIGDGQEIIGQPTRGLVAFYALFWRKVAP